MKRLIALTALLLTSTSAFAEVTIDLTAGILSLSNGDPIPPGTLLQLVASTTDSIFTDPTPGSFVGGSSDDVVVASFSSNTFGGGPGNTANQLIFNLSGTLTTGDPLILRWYPGLTTSSSSPPAGTSFGQYRTDAVTDNSTIGWFVPSEGSTNTLNLQTQSADSNPPPDSAGEADFAVVPEPSTYALTGLGFAWIAIGYFRRRAKS